jgi:hypothetical protein
MKLLVVEEENKLLQSIQEYFTQEDFVCEGVASYAEAMHRIEDLPTIALFWILTCRMVERNIDRGSFVGNPAELQDNPVLGLSVTVPEVYMGAGLLDNTGGLTIRSFANNKFTAKLVPKAGSTKVIPKHAHQ